MIKKGVGFSISEQADRKIATVAEEVGRTKSAALENILMSLSMNTLVRYAKKVPVYDVLPEGVINGSCIGETTQA